MADGYARADGGRAGVCMASRGPGAANLAIGIHNAHAESVPVVAVIGQVPDQVYYRGTGSGPFLRAHYQVVGGDPPPRAAPGADPARRADRPVRQARPGHGVAAAGRADRRRGCLLPASLPAGPARAAGAGHRAGGRAARGGAAAGPGGRRRVPRPRLRPGPDQAGRPPAAAGGHHLAAQERLPERLATVLRVARVRGRPRHRRPGAGGGRGAGDRLPLLRVGHQAVDAVPGGRHADPCRHRPGGARPHLRPGHWHLRRRRHGGSGTARGGRGREAPRRPAGGAPPARGPRAPATGSRPGRQ